MDDIQKVLWKRKNNGVRNNRHLPTDSLHKEQQMKEGQKESEKKTLSTLHSQIQLVSTTASKDRQAQRRRVEERRREVL